MVEFMREVAEVCGWAALAAFWLSTAVGFLIVAGAMVATFVDWFRR